MRHRSSRRSACSAVPRGFDRGLKNPLVPGKEHCDSVPAGAGTAEAPGAKNGSVLGSNGAFFKVFGIQETCGRETLHVEYLNSDIAGSEFLNALVPLGSGSDAFHDAHRFDAPTKRDYAISPTSEENLALPLKFRNMVGRDRAGARMFGGNHI